MSNILYIMKYVDSEGREIGINDKKIGITNNIKNRERDLSGTKGPIKVVHIKAWDLGSRALEMEKLFHSTFNHLKTEGEWFKDENNDLVSKVCKWFSSSFLSNDNITELELNKEEVKLIEKEEKVREETAREKNIRREAILLKKAQGAELTISKFGKEIKVKVVDAGFEVDGTIYERAQTAVNQTAPKLGLEHNGMSFWSNGLINGIKAKKFVEELND